MKRAALIITDARYVDGVTRHRGDETLDDVAEHLWLETDPQLLEDLRMVADEVARRWHSNTRPGSAAARVRAAIGDNDG